MLDIKKIILEFLSKLKHEKVEIYNEFSLQHELGIFLRQKLPDVFIQFERNISHFNIPTKNSVKKEIDISIFSKDKKELLCVIELKFPRNGQYPMQMFSFCKDISFMEHVKKNGFQQAFVLILADDKIFYSGTGDKPPYNFFRASEKLTGCITQPVGKGDDSVNINGSYIVKWHEIINPLKYTLIEIN